MRQSEIDKLAPVVVRRVAIPPDQIIRISRKLRSTDIAAKFATEFFERVMDDAIIEQDDAWQQCAEIAGFKSVADCNSQGLQLVFIDNMIQVREKSHEFKTTP